jgi:transposase
MQYPVRLIETQDSQGNAISIIINEAKMSAQEISDLYRNRWQIELFFKWVKQHLVLKKCYGKSTNAVYNQIYIAMITFCLTLLMKKKVGYEGTLLSMFEFVAEYWRRSFSVFLEELFKKPDRTSKGRRRLDHVRIFNNILIQIEREETWHLNDDLTYDLIF